MGILDCWLRRLIVGCIVVLLAVPFGQAATPQSQQTVGHQAESGRSASVRSQQAQPQTSANANDTPQANANQGTPDAPQPPQGTSNALGTAAAPYEKSTGVPASRPAGAVIAPAKQRRARSFLIKVGVIVGAAVAIGTVVALSKASPNRPN